MSRCMGGAEPALPLNRRSATANLDQEDVHVFWDIETVRPARPRHPLAVHWVWGGTFQPAMFGLFLLRCMACHGL